MSRIGGEYAVKDASDDSVESLCRLFQDVFGKAVEPAVWRWKYLDPALSGHFNVVLCGDGGRILGHAGAVVVPGAVRGRVFPAAQLCDVMLAKPARGDSGPNGPYGTFMTALVSRLRQSIPGGMYYGFPGRRPFLLGERLGLYRGTGPITEFHMPTHATRRQRWRWLRLGPLDWDDPRLDRLWSAYAERCGPMVVRNRRYLSWRYARNPVHAYRLLGVYRGLSLVGWVVLAEAGEVMRCVDRLVDGADLGRVLDLLAGFAGREGMGRLAWWDKSMPPSGSAECDTGLMGVVLPSSAPEFAEVSPAWQPGDADIY